MGPSVKQLCGHPEMQTKLGFIQLSTKERGKYEMYFLAKCFPALLLTVFPQKATQFHQESVGVIWTLIHRKLKKKKKKKIRLILQL